MSATSASRRPSSAAVSRTAAKRAAIASSVPRISSISSTGIVASPDTTAPRRGWLTTRPSCSRRRKRLLHGRRADPHLRGDVALLDALAGLEGAAQDGVADVVVGDVTQRADVGRLEDPGRGARVDRRRRGSRRTRASRQASMRHRARTSSSIVTPSPGASGGRMAPPA